MDRGLPPALPDPRGGCPNERAVTEVFGIGILLTESSQKSRNGNGYKMAGE
jgi:hypothetical protein